MIPSLNDGSGRAPRLRLDLNIGTLWGLSPSVSRPWMADVTGSDVDLGPLRRAGYEGVQAYDPQPAQRAGLAVTGMGRITRPEDVAPLAAAQKDAGMQATTVHLGSGLESDAEIDALVDAVLAVSARLGHPLLIETHRATVTQDIRRTLDLVDRRPEIRFTGDLSHWYTGHELTYGDVEAKLSALEPVLQRVRLLHGRMGDSGAIQLALEGREDREFVRHFRWMWTRCFAGFLASAGPGDVMVFAPELLPAVASVAGQPVRLNYAREVPDGQGGWEEEGDRWREAQRLCGIARECFAAAQAARLP